MVPKDSDATKKIHNIDTKPILTADTVPTGDPWDTKQPEIRQDFIWGAGPAAIEIITKGELNTDPDTIKTDNLADNLFIRIELGNKRTALSCEKKQGENASEPLKTFSLIINIFY